MINMSDIKSIDEANSMICVDGRWKRIDSPTLKAVCYKRDTRAQDIHPGHLGSYRHWLRGQADRLDGKTCLDTNGRYLDGWYSPERTHPDFLTSNQAATLRKYL